MRSTEKKKSEVYPLISSKIKAFDFGTGKSYDVISIVQQMNQCSVSEALKYLEKFDFSVQNEFQNEETKQQKEYKIQRS